MIGTNTTEDVMTKLDRATARLAQLVMTRASPLRVIGATYAVVTELRTQDESWRERLDALQAEIEEGMAVAEDYAAEVGAADKPKALAQLNALQAVHRTLQLEVEQPQSDGGPGIAAALQAAA